MKAARGAVGVTAGTAEAAGSGVDSSPLRKGAESIDERIARQKRERYEASDEFQLKTKNAAEERANISLSAASQLSEEDVVKEQAATQAEGEARVKGWIEEVTGGALDGELGVALRSGVVLCELANTIRPGAQPRPQPLPPAGFLLTP